MKQVVLKVHPNDNVLVALKNLAKGETIVFEDQEYILQNNIPSKHKFFTQDMNAGDEVIMYGVLVGKAQNFVPKGGLVSTANVKHAVQSYDYRGSDYHWHAPDVSKFANRTFNGYHRNDGKVGTANYWLFIPTVFCENRNMDVIREALQNELG
jgi:altronate hydrolase